MNKFLFLNWSILMSLIIYKDTPNCILEKDIAMLKTEIYQNSFFERYDPESSLIIEAITSKEKCLGLFWISIKSKDNRYKIHIPYLRTNNITMFNIDIYEGKKKLGNKSKSAIRKDLKKALIHLKGDFTVTQLKSMQEKFLYGVYSLPLNRIDPN